MATYCRAFGDLFKKHRIGLGKTLRAFCRQHGYDHGNLSKLERGLLKPPTGDRLGEYARNLGIKPQSDEWYEFYDCAAACAGEIPESIMSDEELVAKLPVVFRTVGRKRLSDEDVKELVELLRRS